jgi:glycerol kinase
MSPVYSLVQWFRRMVCLREAGDYKRWIEDVTVSSMSDAWREIQADIYDTPIRCTTDEGPVYGSALLAKVAAGTYGD